ncbi:MAG: hypothetical protein ACKO4Z_14250 [Planctomycetota bacterium]
MSRTKPSHPPASAGALRSRTRRRSAAAPAAKQPGGEGGPPAAAPPAVPRPVAAREATRRIRALAEVGTTLEGRDRLRKLALRVKGGCGDAQRMSFCEAAIGECLDEAVDAAGERWSACEAATWAVAWLARSRRAGGSAGRLLERLVSQARAAQPLLERGDTQPAVFVLTLSRLFADVEACRSLEGHAARALTVEIDRLVSSQGTVSVSGSAAMVERVIRWTVARDVAEATGGAAWPDATDRRWRSAATNAIRLLGGGGRLLAGAGRMPEVFSKPLLEAVAACGRRRKRTIDRLRRNRRDDLRRPGDLGRAIHDPSAAVAVIRTGWGREGVRVLLDYRHAVPRLEVAVADRILVDGPWQWEVWRDDRPLEAEGAWAVSCWESDRKASFLEITAPLGGGFQVERQVVVLARDRVVLLADAITSTVAVAGTAVRYRGLVSFAPALDAHPADETREVVVSDTGVRMLAIPLGLGEWRTAGRGGLETADGGLVLTQETVGGGLYAPLWLDCDPERIGLPLTWRQLTIADTRQAVPPSDASGQRVQAGRDQWLVYRSLAAPRNRTLLGCNVSCEFLLGRVKKSGEVARTLEIQ